MKVKGLTIVEIIIVMVISGVLITLSYWSLNMFTKLFSKSNEHQNTQEEILNLDKDLRSNLKKATRYVYSDHEIILFDANLDSVSYRFQEDSIFRRANKGSTLAIPIETSYTLKTIQDEKRNTHSFVIKGKNGERYRYEFADYLPSLINSSLTNGK